MFYKEYTELSKRAKNVIKDLGGVDKLVSYYDVNSTFKDLRKCGAKTKLELEDLVKVIKQNNVQSSSIESRIKSVFDYYKDLKSTCYPPLEQLLSKIEVVYSKQYGEDYMDNFLNSVFINPQKSIFPRKYNIKIVRQYDEIRLKIVSYSKAIGKVGNGLNTSVLNKNQIESMSAILSMFEHAVHDAVSIINQLPEIIEENSFPFKKLLLFYVSSHLKNNKSHNIVKRYFFSEENNENYRVIAKKEHCSFELVRVSIKLFTEGNLMDFIHRIKRISLKPNDMPDTEKNLCLEFDTFESCFGLNPNYKFTELVLEAYYSDSTTVNNILNKNKDFRVFNLSENVILFKNRSVLRFKLDELFSYLTHEIYNFEKYNFEYDMKTLIQSFCMEKSIAISIAEMGILLSIVHRIKKTTIEIKEADLSRVQLEISRNYIYNKVYALLYKSQKTLLTNQIMTYLSTQGIELEKAHLLYLLNKSKRFIRFGNGVWGLAEWKEKNPNNLKGSFREIVADLLEINNEPMHISEITKRLSEFREVSDRSIWTNLKSYDKRVFVFFNCHFVGLSKATYDPYWTDIPVFKWGKVVTIFKDPDLDVEQKVKLITAKGYPEVHVRYIFNTNRDL